MYLRRKGRGKAEEAAMLAFAREQVTRDLSGAQVYKGIRHGYGLVTPLAPYTPQFSQLAPATVARRSSAVSSYLVGRAAVAHENT